ncbi:MAG: type II restriction endonuclease [Nitrospirae bacterium]|nr:type II restriction endonuclease [Nitrospirota bacterium]
MKNYGMYKIALIRIIPILLACREKSFKILTDFTGGKFTYEDFRFTVQNVLSDEDIEKAYRFADNTGILSLFRQKSIKNIVDYVIGVEVGLDSNGRKNRGGTTMESIVEGLLKPICSTNKLDYITQATARRVRAKWGIDLKVDKSSRRFDFAIRYNDNLCLIETNYYGGGGSKLKATAGEYKALFDFIKANGHGFIWITDGAGWKATLRPLEETFNHIDYTLNLNMVCNGVLEKLVKELLY